MPIIKKICNYLETTKLRRLIRSNFVSVEVVKCGSTYGGFYVLPPQKYGKSSFEVVMSFGIGEDLSFSEDIINKYDSKVYAFDPTPKSINYVKNHELSTNNSFKFFPVGLSDKDEITQFHLPKNSNYVSGSVVRYNDVREDFINVEMKSLLTICHEQQIKNIDVLKIDIEGSEFDVIPNILKSGIEVNQICFETHERFFKDGNQRLFDMFKVLIDNDYKVIAKGKVELVYTVVKNNILQNIIK